MGFLGLSAEHRIGQLAGGWCLPVILALTFLTGHPQEWFLLVLALTAWCRLRCMAKPGVARAAPGVGATARLGRRALIFRSASRPSTFAPQLAVRPWLAQQSRRPRRCRDPAAVSPVVLNAWQLLSPTALGGPSDYFGDDNYWETLFSIGLVPLCPGGDRGAPASRPQAGSRLARARRHCDLAGLRAASRCFLPWLISRFRA